MSPIVSGRPIYHRDDDRVRGHIFVAVLAFLLKRALDKKLKAAGSNLSGESALEALCTIHVVEVRLGSERKRGTTVGSSRARQVLNALGITDLDPPQSHQTA